jgi:hypothetical protein
MKIVVLSQEWRKRFCFTTEKGMLGSHPLFLYFDEKSRSARSENPFIAD